MGEAFIFLVKRIGIFLIIGQTILHFGIGAGYEKYVRVVISFMVVAQLAAGILSFFHADSGSYIEELIMSYEQDIATMEFDLRQLEKRMREEPQPEETDALLETATVITEPAEIEEIIIEIE